MVYTVTCNPSLDYLLWTDEFQPEKTNRAGYTRLLPGGKGLNVSTILNRLGVENVALGFVAGFTGNEIRRLFALTGGMSDFIELKEGVSRINVKIKAARETELNAPGPDIDPGSMERLLSRLDRLSSGDILVLAGSIPPSLPDSLYRDIMERLADRGICTVVDATQELLSNVLEWKPFLIKPNNHELGDIFGVELRSRSEVIPYARKLQERGARNVLVSMGGAGAVLLAETGEVFQSEAPSGRVKNTVGSGDSMVAGFVAGWQETGNYAHAFRLGVSAGSASAFSEELATKAEIQGIYQSVTLL